MKQKKRQRIFKKSIDGSGKLESVVIDKSGSNLAALKSINKNKKESDKIKINRSKYLNNIVEQDHMFIKKEQDQYWVLKV